MFNQDRARIKEARCQLVISRHPNYDKAIADVLWDCLRSGTDGGVQVFWSSFAGPDLRLRDIPHQYGP